MVGNSGLYGFHSCSRVNEDRHSKLLGGFMEELEKGMTSCKDGASSLCQVLIAGCCVPGGMMGRSCAAPSQFKAKLGPKNPRWYLTFPSKADSIKELSLGLLCVDPDLCGVV